MFYLTMHWAYLVISHGTYGKGRKEGNVLFNHALNTFYLRLCGIRHMVKDHTDSKRGKDTHCHMGYSFWLTERVLLYASSHRQDNTYHSLCYTSHGTINSTMGSPWRIDLMTHRTTSEHSYHGTTSCSLYSKDAQTERKPIATTLWAPL